MHLRKIPHAVAAILVVVAAAYLLQRSPTGDRGGLPRVSGTAQRNPADARYERDAEHNASLDEDRVPEHRGSPTATEADETAPPLKETPPPANERKRDEPQLGQLQDVGGGVLVSTAGLRYTPGGQEGHRLDHVLRHDNDIPDRPGKHGVFDGDRQTLLAVLDEAYLLAKKRSPQVHARREGERTVHEIDMKRRIGYVGGRDGKQAGHPPARRIRMVLEGDRLITAFPY